MDDTTASIIDIEDENPAKIREAKNITPIIPFIPGRALIACGNTTKASPTPAEDTSATLTP